MTKYRIIKFLLENKGMGFLKTFGFLFLLLVMKSAWAHSQPTLKNGFWHAALLRPDGQQIDFNFETKDSNGKKILYVLNASEKLLVDNITCVGDSVLIQMPFFDSGFRGKLDAKGNLSGLWIKRLADRDQVMPFTAIYNQHQRFAAHHKSKFNITGKWATSFASASNAITEAIGEFKQNGNKITGTFLTTTGDYRFLEGVVSGDSVKLSGFDGGHAFLFVANILNNTTIGNGMFYSGLAPAETWTAKKDNKATLPDGYSETKLRPGENHLDFKFKSINGDSVSINDAAFKNKVVVIQIMGSWCPNCMDETNFLSDYYNQNKQKGFAVMALAYERTTDYDRSKTSIERFQKRFNVQYPILVTGVSVSDPMRTEKTLPQIQKLEAFPTSIFIDKKGKVRKIYSGFNGPGTGAHYEEFKKEFNSTINELLAEQ